MASDEQRRVYDQEWQNYRSQDSLRWSRFQTVALIEGAYLAALYTPSTLAQWRGLVLALFASALVLIVCWLAYEDGKDAEEHLKRVRTLEKSMEMEMSYLPPLSQTRRGRALMCGAIVVVNLFNLAVIIDSAMKVGSCTLQP